MLHTSHHKTVHFIVARHGVSMEFASILLFKSALVLLNELIYRLMKMEFFAIGFKVSIDSKFDNIVWK